MTGALPSSPVLAALYQGKRELAEQLLAANPPLDIFEAAAVDATDHVAELLAADPQLARAGAPDGFTALHLAAFFGAPGAARMLLAAGADPVAVADSPPVQPLHSAVAGRHVEIARLLVEAGADPDAQQEAGLTALMAAAHAGHEELVRLLLDARADPLVPSDDGRTARDFAIADGHSRIADLLAEAAARRER